MLAKALQGASAVALPVYVEDVFSAYVYSGQASGTITVSNGVDLLNKGGLVWIKSRGAIAVHNLLDTTRGITSRLQSNSISLATTEAFLGTVTSTGFTLPANYADVSGSSDNYVAWTFRKQQKFFDIVTYTGNGGTQNVTHNLGSVPGCVMVKTTSGSTGNWYVYHRTIGQGARVSLDTLGASTTDATIWNNTAPTSTQFTVGPDNANLNGSTYVAYLFAHDAGGFGADGLQNIISCGGYSGNGGTGTSVNLGWEPQFLLIKGRSGGNTNWTMVDATRGSAYLPTTTLSSNYSFSSIFANTTAAEANNNSIRFTPTGFQPMSSSNDINGSGYNYIYIAIRRPMKPPTSGTEVFSPTVYTGTNVDNRLVNTGMFTDMAWVRQRNDTVLGGMVVGDRMRGNAYLLTGATDTESVDADSIMRPGSSGATSAAFGSMTGFGVGNDVTSKLNASTTANNQIAEAFKRAPGFFDIVCYTGNGVAGTAITHGLGAKPQINFIKKRNAATGWIVYTDLIDGSLDYLQLNGNNAKLDSAENVPTSSVFYLSSGTNVNNSGDGYVSYLFGNVDGVSKCGVYTGNGTSQTINCGFTAGARFVLIKRTDSTGDWYVWDSARGIVSGNDPRLSLNTTAAEVTTDDTVDADNSGFIVNQVAATNVNEGSGVTWVTQTSGFGTNDIHAVAYGNGLFLAGGQSGTLTTSTDGVTWTSRTSGFGTTRIYSIAYGNGIYVAVGDSGVLTTSTDGITWTSRTSGFGTNNISGVAYGNGTFVAVGSGSTITTSTDGVTWTSRTPSTVNALYDVTYGNGQFVIVGNGGDLATSSNGITWTSRTSGTTNALNTVVYGNGLYVVGGDSGELRTSTDGVTWTSRNSLFGTSRIDASAYGNGVFVIVGTNGKISTSSNGTSWTAQTYSLTNGLKGIVFANNMFVSGGALGTLITNNPQYLYLAIA